MRSPVNALELCGSASSISFHLRASVRRRRRSLRRSMCPQQIGGSALLAAAVGTEAHKFLIDLSSSGTPLTCTKVFDQQRRRYSTSVRHERLDCNRIHQFVPWD